MIDTTTSKGIEGIINSIGEHGWEFDLQKKGINFHAIVSKGNIFYKWSASDPEEALEQAAQGLRRRISKEMLSLQGLLMTVEQHPNG